MIDRYSIHASAEQLISRFKIEDPHGYKPRYNAAPTQILPVITHESPQGFSFFYWGSEPRWIKNKTIAERIINTRGELIKEKPVLKKNLRTHRCIIPADGFYAWKKVGKKTVMPWRIILKSNEVFSFAGLWEEYDDEEGNSYHTFSLITLPSVGWLTDITDRSPLIFTKEVETLWMDKNATEAQLLDLIQLYPVDKLEGYHVSPMIHSTEYDVPSLIKPTPPADQFGNLTLFD